MQIKTGVNKILVVVDSIDIDDSSGSKANVALINNLGEAGFEVLVYHYTRRDIALQGVSTYNIPEIKYSPFYFLSRTQRFLARTFNLNLMPFFEKRFGFSFTFFNDTNSIQQALKKLTYQSDLIITLSKGGSFRPHYALLKFPELHHKWMAYVHDPYPFHYYPRPYNWVEPGYEIRENFFRKVSEKAKYSSFPSYLLQEWMGSYFPNFLKTGIIIPHQSSKYKIQKSVFPTYFDVSKFNILHAGNLLKQRSPEGLIKGFKLFLERNPKAKRQVKLILLGPASYHTIMLEEHQKSCSEIYIYNGLVSFDEVYNLQKNTTINIILESKSEISPFLPAKFPHCVSANKPILLLGPHLSETKRLLGEEYEYWSEADDFDKIADLIEKLFQKWLQNPNILLLNRKDLEYYISVARLKEQIINLKLN